MPLTRGVDKPSAELQCRPLPPAACGAPSGCTRRAPPIRLIPGAKAGLFPAGAPIIQEYSLTVRFAQGQ